MPKKTRQEDSKAFEKKMRGRFVLSKAQRAEKQKQGILPGWESPPEIPKATGFPKEKKFSFKNMRRVGGFLSGEANRFLKSAEAAAKRAMKAAKPKAKYTSSREEALGAHPIPDQPPKGKKGYRTGKVPKVKGPVVQRFEETSSKPFFKPTKLGYHWERTKYDQDTGQHKGVKHELSQDTEAYIKANPMKVAQYMQRRRLEKLKKKDPRRYEMEKAAMVGVGLGLVGYEAYHKTRKLWKKFDSFTRDL